MLENYEKLKLIKEFKKDTGLMPVYIQMTTLIGWKKS